MKITRRHGIVAGAVVALAVVVAWAMRPRPVEVEAAAVTLGRFEDTVDEDGRTRLVDRYVVSAPLTGRLARITLREGDAVDAGAAIAGIAPALPALLDERSGREAQARADGAAAQLARSEARIARANVAVEQTRLELRRSEQLARDGFIAPTKLDGDRLALQAAQRELDTAVQERHMAAHDLEQARAALGAIRPGAPGRDFPVRAPVAGRVLRVLQASEGTVALGTPLLEIGALDRLEVVAPLLTTDALRCAPGTPVRIERWGGPDTLDGRVRLVEPAAFTKVSALGVEEQRVNVVIELTSPRERWAGLGDAFRVGVRVIVLAQDNVVLVPSSAVFPMPEADDHQMATFVIEDGRARLRPVQLAARHASAAWVSAGLKPGERVIVYPGMAVHDGARVRERQP